MTQQNSLILIDDSDNMAKCYYLDGDEKTLLADINHELQRTTIYPVHTRIGSTDFLESKYSVKFLFEGYDIDVETRPINEATQEEIHLLTGLPKVFIQTLEHGLGLKKEYRFIAGLTRKVPNCELIVISKTRQTSLDGTNIVINDSDLDKIRRGFDRIKKLYNDVALQSKEVFVYHEILTNINGRQFPEIPKQAKKDVVYRIVKDIDFSKSISDTSKKSLLKIKDDIDLGYFKVLKRDFDKKIENNQNETDFQQFFKNAPLLLTLFSGSSYILVKDQAYCGGKSFNNRNGQFTDFLYKNKLTNNSFIIEIKCPGTKLLEANPYRKTGVYSPSKELSGAVSQVITQKYQLETDIASLIKNAEDRKIEVYNVQCLLIIGLLKNLNEENEKAKKRSFELFRNNQKNVRIITYDECQTQLNLLLEVMKQE